MKQGLKNYKLTEFPDRIVVEIPIVKNWPYIISLIVITLAALSTASYLLYASYQSYSATGFIKVGMQIGESLMYLGMLIVVTVILFYLLSQLRYLLGGADVIMFGRQKIVFQQYKNFLSSSREFELKDVSNLRINDKKVYELPWEGNYDIKKPLHSYTNLVISHKKKDIYFARFISMAEAKEIIEQVHAKWGI
ncbi:MAG: hypothetical protein AAFY71_00415 [Bacteroidota bacterium]